MNRNPTHFKTLPVLVALGLHGLIVGLLLVMPGPGDLLGSRVLRATGEDGVSWFRLAALPEGNSAVFMPSSHRMGVPPVGLDGLPDAQAASGADMGAGILEGADPASDVELAEMLALEREALQAELEQMTQMAMAAPTPTVGVLPLPAAGQRGGADEGPEGAVRELNLEGYPSDVVDDIMSRYKLRVVMKEFAAGVHGQNFLSSASRGPGEHYFGGASVPAGVYEVFQLSRDTVALMSRLEEDAIRERGMEPLGTRVIRIVFGIVESKTGEYELGVKSLEAEKVSP